MEKIMEMLFILVFTMIIAFSGFILILLGHGVYSNLSGEVNECIRAK